MMDWDAAAFQLNAAQRGLVTVKKSLSMPLCGMGGGKINRQGLMVGINHGVLLAESIAVSVALKATDTSLTAPTAALEWTVTVMRLWWLCKAVLLLIEKELKTK